VTWGGFSADEIRALAPDHVVTRPSELIAVLARD
jgi:phosphoglycolate phosphatase-like HAD superfamily hydrolase